MLYTEKSVLRYYVRFSQIRSQIVSLVLLLNGPNMDAFFKRVWICSLFFGMELPVDCLLRFRNYAFHCDRPGHLANNVGKKKTGNIFTQ